MEWINAKQLLFNCRLLPGFDNGIELRIFRNRLFDQLKAFATFVIPIQRLRPRDNPLVVGSSPTRPTSSW